MEKGNKNATALPPHYRWNYAMGLIHGITFRLGMAFSEPYSLIPVFLHAFTPSRSVIGLIISMIRAGNSLPQLLVAKFLLHRAREKPVLVLAIWLRWLSWFLLSAITFFFGARYPLLVLVSLMVLLSLFSIGGGIASVPFFTLISRAIPPERRGRFMGLRQFIGGLLAIAGGYLVKLILASESLPFPRNYGLLFFLTSAIIGTGYVALSLFREEPAPSRQDTKPEPQPFGYILRRLLREYPPLRLVILAEITSSVILMSLPFFVLHAREALNLPASFVGYLVMAQMFGGVFSNFLWAKLSDSYGNRTVIWGTSAVAVLAIFLALVGRSFLVTLLVFLFAGSYLSGSGIGFYNYVMEIGTAKARPILISAFGTLILPIYFYPLIGGILADAFGYTAVFVFSLILTATSFVPILRLCEPRGGGKSCELPFLLE